MKKDRHIIAGVHITDRAQQVAMVQPILSKYGCLIKTRLGLHEASKDSCSKAGILVLELLDDEAKIEGLMGELAAIEGVEVQRIVFGHP